jgi:hypothetical protein
MSAGISDARTMGKASLRLVSGVGKKGPACFLIEAGGRRFLLDLGEGPPLGALPDVAVAEARQSAGLCH